MNKWQEVWNRREDRIELSDDTFQMFCKLKSADGFDTQTEEGYYEAFYQQWHEMNDRIMEGCQNSIDSVYEVGCGSGVNLYMFSKTSSDIQLGGIDYSKPLINLARKVVQSRDLRVGEALQIEEEKQYDVVLSDSVFQYFQTPEYGYQVLEKMYNKAKKMVVITELHDIKMYEEHMAYRKSLVENYEEHYRGLEKTFYSRKSFIEFAESKNCRYEIIKPNNDRYWNNKYVFDFYLYK